MDTYLETELRRIYRETSQFFSEIEPRLGPNYRSYEILYGPPKIEPALMIIGFQPGDGRADRDPIVPQVSWPEQVSYAHARWALARRLQEAFGRNFLDTVTGANLVFARWKDVASYASDVDRHTRRLIADRSRGWLEGIVRLLRPRKILVIGLGTAERLGSFAPHLFSSTSARKDGSPRLLATCGSFCGVETLAVTHLSGSRISGADRDLINKNMREFAGLRPVNAMQGEP